MQKSICNQDIYHFGKEIAPNIYRIAHDKTKLIKKVSHITEANHSKKASELQVGPHIYDIVSCKIDKKIPKFSIAQQRARAKGIVIPDNEIHYDIQSNDHHYIVMQNIIGHELRKNEVDEYINDIYIHYMTLWENDIYISDIARQNIMVDKSKRVYIIDYEFSDYKENKKTKQEIRDLLFNQKLYQNSKSRSLSSSHSSSKNSSHKSNKQSHSPSSKRKTQKKST